MSDIGNRHAGNLDGKLSSPGFGAKVSIAVDDEFAGYKSTQHLVWMLLNLLARQPKEICSLKLEYKRGIKIEGYLSPLVRASDDFFSAVIEAVHGINPTVVGEGHNESSRIFVRVGPGEIETSDFSIAVSADHWSGYVGSTAAPILTDSTNPIGAYVGASLAAAEIFKHVRKVRPGETEFPQRLWFNAFTLELSENPTDSPVVWELTPLPETTLAGVGAVGSALLQTLYTFPGCAGLITAVDGDEKGITETNLNRYVLSDLRHIRELHRKATTASILFKDHAVQIAPFDEPWQTAYESRRIAPQNFVLSAVDRNSARHAIQDAMPQKILGAATNELKLQVNLYDVLEPASVCLKCRNRVEAEGIPDEVVVEQLRELSDEALAAAAVTMGVSLEDLKLYIEDPKVHCGKVSGSSLQKFAESSDEGEWSVGFVSFLAGVLLAAEYLKQIHGANQRMTQTRNQLLFQFWRPAGSVNRLTIVPPEATCLCRSDFYQEAIARHRSIP